MGAGEMSFTDMMQVRSWAPLRPVGCMRDSAFPFFMHGTGVNCGPLRGCMPDWCQGTSLMVPHLWACHKHRMDLSNTGRDVAAKSAALDLLAHYSKLVVASVMLGSLLKVLHLCSLVCVRERWTGLLELPCCSSFCRLQRSALVLCGAGLPGHRPGRHGGFPGTDGLPRCG